MADLIGRLPLKSLNIFRVVARLNSFKQAAEELCVTSQAVSLQVRSLESALGITLFQRFAAGVGLTPAGERLYEYTERSLQLLEQGIREAQSCQQRRQFRINASPWFAIHRLLPVLEQFEQQHPDVDVKITTAVGFPDFVSQRLDCAIQWGWGQWPSSAKQLLLKDDKRLVCAPSLISAQKPLDTPADLKHHRLLCTELSVALWQQLSNTLSLDLLLERQTLILDSQASQVEATEKGLGVALISDALALEACKEGRLVMPLWETPVSVLNPSLLPGYWLVMGEERQQDELTLAFKKWLFNTLKNDARFAGF
ncbi:LysR substrate-binding domain-containing protein [Neptunomonas japonica]|uniref:LysR substrate-binding domain-containing protein n=1 Tax=Neptunomonas japonica TaxID=417574 RepID=UPI00041F69FE|nr:LysR substrate-binding domain-containing protein [Neptunomonas japonica]